MNQLATVQNPKYLSLVSDEWSRDRVELVKATYCKGASDDELMMFIGTCQKLGLSPEARQVFAVKRWDSSQRREVMSIQVSIDGFRLIAERTGKYAGQMGPAWCGKDGQWVDCWLEDGPPAAAKVGVLRSDWKEPIWAVARYKSYVQTTKQGDPTKMWQKMDDLMLAKCAESLALRKAFPNELSGLYTSDEMSQAGGHQQPTPAPKPAQKVDPEKAKWDRLEKMLQVFSQLAREEGIEPGGIRYILEDYCESKPYNQFGEVEFKKLQELYTNIKNGKTSLKQVCEKVYPNKTEPAIEAKITEEEVNEVDAMEAQFAEKMADE